MKKIILIGFIVASAGGIIWSEGNHALAQRTGLTISPLNFELTANPGDTLTNTLRVFNPSGLELTVQMTVEDFAVAGEAGQVLVEPVETESYSLARWVTVSPDIFTLLADGRQTVEFTITVPESAEPGGHYGTVLASLTAAAGGGGLTGAAVAQKVGSLVLLSVSGNAVEDLRIKEFTAPEFLEYGPIPFVIRFENQGTVHVRPRGFVTITNWLDKKVMDLEFPQKNVLPGSVRKVETSWDAKWLFGKYAATVVGSYGTTNTPISPRVITFWVIPWKVVSAAGAGLFIVLVFFFLTRRRWITALKILLRGEKRTRF